MKQVLSLLLLGLIITSCSTEEVQIDQTADATLTVVSGENDFTNYGIYKGSFAAAETSFRGTVVIDVTYNQAMASLILPDNTQIKFSAKHTFTTDLSPQTITFESEVGSFNFKVNANGTNPVVTDVNIFSTEGSIVVAKEKSTLAISVITGTFGCTECEGHPMLSDPELQDTFTWNLIFQGDGEGEDLVTSQVTFGPRTYMSYGTQANPYAKIGDLIYADMEGRFRFGAAGQIGWDAAHMFNLSEGCKDVTGTWELISPSYTINGWLRSDSTCNGPGN